MVPLSSNDSLCDFKLRGDRVFDRLHRRDIAGEAILQVFNEVVRRPSGLALETPSDNPASPELVTVLGSPFARLRRTRAKRGKDEGESRQQHVDADKQAENPERR